MPSEVEELLTNKGPGKIPVWAYGVGIAGLFLAYEWYRNRSSSASTSGQNASQPPAPGTTTVTKTVSDGGGGGPWPWRPFWTIGPGQPPNPQSNTEWRHMAADWLESKGEPTGRVNDVLADYLDGQQLDRTEQRLVDLAVDEWGRPPDGVKPGIRVQNFGGGSSDSDVADTGAAGPDPGGSGGAGRASADIRVTDKTVDRRDDRRDRRRRRDR